MCYVDGPGVVVRRVCPDQAHEGLLDCNHDDYFSLNPAAGSYLATHWNTAESSFLVAGSDPATTSSSLRPHRHRPPRPASTSAPRRRLPPPPPPPPAATKYLVTASSSSVAAGGFVTVTAQLATSNGVPVATAGKTVTWSKAGSGRIVHLAGVVDHTSGVASVTFTTGTSAGGLHGHGDRQHEPDRDERADLHGRRPGVGGDHDDLRGAPVTSRRRHVFGHRFGPGQGRLREQPQHLRRHGHAEHEPKADLGGDERRERHLCGDPDRPDHRGTRDDQRHHRREPDRLYSLRDLPRPSRRSTSSRPRPRALSPDRP